jgi:hypothetical protein
MIAVPDGDVPTTAKIQWNDVDTKESRTRNRLQRIDKK